MRDALAHSEETQASSMAAVVVDDDHEKRRLVRQPSQEAAKGDRCCLRACICVSELHGSIIETAWLCQKTCRYFAGENRKIGWPKLERIAYNCAP